MNTLKWVLPVMLGLHGVDACAGWPDDVGVELRSNNNLTRAQLDKDIKGDTALVLSAAGGTRYWLSDNSRLTLNLMLSSSAYKRYQGLDNLNAGLELGYRWKIGLGLNVPLPVFDVRLVALDAEAVSLDLAGDGAEEGGREAARRTPGPPPALDVLHRRGVVGGAVDGLEVGDGGDDRHERSV